MDSAQEYEALVQFMYLAPIGLAQTSLSGEIAMINPLSAQLLMPLSRDGNLANLFTALEPVAPELRKLVEDFSAPYGQVCDALRMQVTAGIPGKKDPQILAITLLKLDPQRLMAVIKDVTLEIQRERQLKHNEAWFNAIMTSITDYALVGLDAHGCVTEWNSSIGRVTGFSAADVRGQPFSIFYPAGGITPDRMRDRMRDADDNGWSLDDGWRMKADGQLFWGSALLAPLRDRSERTNHAELPHQLLSESAYCLVIRDISDKREAHEQLRQATHCDHLTSVANRRAFFEAATLEIGRAQHSPRETSLILMDVDFFKQINDSHGHPAGDEVLRQLGALLMKSFREVDVVARVGGEEFAVLLPSTGQEAATQVANRFREAVAAHTVQVDGHFIHFTLSGGVVTLRETEEGLDDLMKRADRVLYAAKAAGRNRIFTESSI
jgi:diguanylate cyclase (GGDEF)-like protein/PAS domain S-box-containing protein